MVLLEVVEEVVVERGSLLLTVGVGVVLLTLQGGAELDVGVVVGAGFADRFERAVEFDGSLAPAVAEHAPRVRTGERGDAG